MKTFNFIFKITDIKISRTYGGSNYTAKVYQIINNEPVLIGEQKACTRGHKGEESEAFSVIVKNCPNIIKTISGRAKKVLKTEPNNYYAKNFLKDVKNSGGYYSWQFRELGLNLRQI
jgi:hypothetical protein